MGQGTRRVSTVHARLFDVLHDAADEGAPLGVTQTIYVTFDGVVQKTIEQHGGVIGDFDRFAHVAFQVTLLMHDFHGAPAQHVTGAHEHGEAEARGRGEAALGQARALNNYFALTGNPDYFNEDLSRYKALAPDDIQMAVQTMLRTDAMVILSVVPQGKTDLAVPGKDGGK